jgi:hypothetical protein
MAQPTQLQPLFVAVKYLLPLTRLVSFIAPFSLTVFPQYNCVARARLQAVKVKLYFEKKSPPY